MKTILVIFYILSVTRLFGQDIEMLDYINHYRKHNGKTELKLSKELSSISVEQNKKIMTEDSLSHSHKSSEIVTMGKNLPSTDESKNAFMSFVKSIGLKYVEPTTNDEAIKYFKLYCLFLFDKSPKHKEILLGNYANVGLDFVVNNISYKSNEIVVNGKTVKFNKIKSHYIGKFYCVVNFN